MRDLFKTLSCIAALALAGPAMAQDTGTGDQPAADSGGATAQPAPPVDPTLSMGQDDGKDKVGSAYAKDQYGDWEMRCVHAPEGQKDPCQLYQLLDDGQGNSVAEISVFSMPEGQQAAAGATIVTPLETLLTQQLRLSVDDAKAKRYPFSWCNQTGCFARVGFTAEDVAAFKAGAEAKLTVVPVAAPDQTVDIKVSLSGFTNGYDAMTAWNNSK